jgi:hypothetical protein
MTFVFAKQTWQNRFDQMQTKKGRDLDDENRPVADPRVGARDAINDAETARNMAR